MVRANEIYVQIAKAHSPRAPCAYVLGAECTGKSTLAQALTSRFHKSTAPRALAAEYLRDWCDQHQRTPNAPNSKPLQTHRCSVLTHRGQWRLGGRRTTALMTAIYSDVLFQDVTLCRGNKAPAQLRLDLVTGTDLPWVADGFLRDGTATRATIDRKLRFVLQSHKIDHTVIYGMDERRIQCALRVSPTTRKSPCPAAPMTPTGSGHVTAARTRIASTVCSADCCLPVSADHHRWV